MNESEPTESLEEPTPHGFTTEKLEAGVREGVMWLGGKTPEGRVLAPYSFAVLDHRVEDDGAWKIAGMHEGRYIVVQIDSEMKRASVVEVAKVAPEKREELVPWGSTPDPQDLIDWVDTAQAN